VVRQLQELRHHHTSVRCLEYRLDGKELDFERAYYARQAHSVEHGPGIEIESRARMPPDGGWTRKDLKSNEWPKFH